MESSTQITELFNQLEILKSHLNTFINFNNEIIDKNSLELNKRYCFFLCLF
jgi:hypothetical protein